ncbi:MAG: alpha amylase C-terminal domain-containing protein, partial [Massilia sp.]|nr:alpha amylase C-terminal domain-containing protein [Massilia sp.]
FEWITHEDRDNSVLSFIRHGANGDTVLVLCNFTPVARHGYRIGVAQAGRYREIINTDATLYGGSGVGNGELQTESIAAHGRACSLSLSVPPLATLMLTLAP